MTDYTDIIAHQLDFTIDGKIDVKRSSIYSWPGKSNPYFEQFNGFKIDVDPKGKMIIMKNKDIPGVVGKVGNILGENGINISDFRLSRGKEGTALAVILIDEKANSKVISELDNLEASIAVAYAEI
jgi:predicted amino acid-binding ACT domain protein